MNLLGSIKKGHEKYPALTGIRAVGASVIFFDHFPLHAHSHIVINILSFFFVLSGFLIIRIYYDDLKPLSKGHAQYFVNRFARIYPVYFLVLTMTVCVQNGYTPLVLLKNYTLTHALYHFQPDFIIQPSWSLTTEECFYFLAPIIMFIIRQWGVLVSFASLSLLLGLALLVSSLPMVFLHTPTFVFSTTFFGHYAEFFAGICLALVVMKQEKEKGTIKRTGYSFTLGGLAGVALLISVMTHYYKQSAVNTSAIILVNNFLIPIPVAVLYYGLMSEHTFVARILSSRLLDVFGRSSYTFYLLHTLIIDQVSLPALQHASIDRGQCVLLTFVGTQLLALLIYIFYEQPLNTLIRQEFNYWSSRLKKSRRNVV